MPLDVDLGNPAHVYSLDTGQLLREDSPEYTDAVMAAQPIPIAELDDGTVALYEARTGRWLEVDFGGELTDRIGSFDGKHAVVTIGNGQFILLDFEKMTRQELRLPGPPLSLSPNNSYLLVDDAGSDTARYAVVSLSGTGLTMPVPYGTASGPDAQGRVRWLTDETLLVWAAPSLLQSFEVGEDRVSLIEELAMPSQHHVLNYDRTMLAVQEGEPHNPIAIHLYQLSPLRHVGQLDGASLGLPRDVGASIWSRDNQRILTVANPCTPAEELHLHDLPTGSEVTIASMPAISRFVFSPDGEWIALTSEDEGYVVASDGTTPPVLVADGVDWTAPRWMPDSNRVLFWAARGKKTECPA